MFGYLRPCRLAFRVQRACRRQAGLARPTNCISGPENHNRILAVSDECRPDNPAAPKVGPAVECLVESNIRVHDAFGYWPVRSFRTSEAAAQAYLHLYQTLGGSRHPG